MYVFMLLPRRDLTSPDEPRDSQGPDRNGFLFPAGTENRSRLHGPDKWSAERGTFRSHGEAAGDDKLDRGAVQFIV